MGISDLSNIENRTMPIEKRYDKKTLKQYESDLRRVNEMEAEGKPRPTLAAIQDYFLTELGMNVQEGTIRRHLNILKKGNILWGR